MQFIFSQPASLGKPEGAGIVETNAAPEGQSESRPSGRNSAEMTGAGAFFRVTLPVPPSLNNAYKNVKRGRVLTKEAKDYKESAKQHIEKLARQFRCPAGARFALSMKLYFSSNHRRDVSNCAKLPEDALSEVLGFDDCRVDRLLVERSGVDAANPRCEITLEVL